MLIGVHALGRQGDDAPLLQLAGQIETRPAVGRPTGRLGFDEIASRRVDERVDAAVAVDGAEP